VLSTVVLFRPMWLFPAAALARAAARRRQAPVPYGWRETSVVSWAGMRGVVTVATALALPYLAEDGTELDWRAPVVLVGLACVLVTLVVQGLTLTPLVRRLGVGSDTDEHAEVSQLRRDAMRVAVQTLREEAGDPPDPAHQAVILQYEARLTAQQVVHDAVADIQGEGPDHLGEQFERRLQHVFQRGNAIERETALTARTEGTVTPASADEVLHEIEVRAARPGP
jgi:CPA1 family monovalent cation:H+ antiporter